MYVRVCVCVCVLSVFIYLLCFSLNVRVTVGVLPFDGEIKMYIIGCNSNCSIITLLCELIQSTKLISANWQ